MILVSYPAEMDITNLEVQAAIRKGLITAYRKEAKEYLPNRLAELGQDYGFEYNRVFIKIIVRVGVAALPGTTSTSACILCGYLTTSSIT